MYNDIIAYSADQLISPYHSHPEMNPHSTHITDLKPEMRIALIYLGRRGAGSWIGLELARQLQNTFPILAVVSQFAEQRSAWERLEVEHLISRTFRYTISALLSLLLPLEVNRLVRKIDIFQPDVLLFIMFHPWNALIAQRMTSIPSVVFIHDPKPHPDLTGWVYGKLEQSSIRQAKRCIILSENLVDEMIMRGAYPEQIDVIPLGPYSNNSSHDLMPLKRDTPTILFFGRIVQYKGLDILLQAYSDVLKIRQARLVIAGEGNLRPYQEMLKNLSDVKIINHWIPEEDIEKLFCQSDILVLPYTSASQSGVIPIAASVGLPVIATRTGGVSEQIEDGQSGWLVKPGSKDDLATAITEALDHPDLARQRGNALRMRYESQFNWEKIALQVAESLKKATRTRGRN